MITNATETQLFQALSKLNEMYDGNISLVYVRRQSKNRNRFRLAAKSGKKGSRWSCSGDPNIVRKLPCASWHAHGYYFDFLFTLDPNIWIQSRGNKITKDRGNWQDIQIGSIMNPLYMSDTSIGEDD